MPALIMSRNCILHALHCCLSLYVLQYPLLVAHHGRVAALPGIKEYLASPARLDKVNNNNLG
jgi:hypothetical protein